MSGSARCRTCGRPIVWAVSVNGKNIPLDPEPRADGNLIRTASTEDGKIVFHVSPYLEPGDDTGDTDGGDVKRYVSHFVTCPYAAQHRHRRRS